jgi:ferredoxin
MKITIDERRCQGFGMCALAAPELFKVGEKDGYAVALVSEVTHEQIEAARAAVENCPMHAIELTEQA